MSVNNFFGRGFVAATAGTRLRIALPLSLNVKAFDFLQSQLIYSLNQVKLPVFQSSPVAVALRDDCNLSKVLKASGK